MFRIIYFRAIAKSIAILIGALRFFVVKRDRINAKLRQIVQFRRFRNSVVVRVLPQPQRRKDRVSAIDLPVAITAISWLVVFGEREKSIAFDSRW